MRWTCNSMKYLLSYYGLVDAKRRASDKDITVLSSVRLVHFLGEVIGQQICFEIDWTLEIEITIVYFNFVFKYIQKFVKNSDELVDFFCWKQFGLFWLLHPRIDKYRIFKDPSSKEIFRTCNVLPFSCNHLALKVR